MGKNDAVIKLGVDIYKNEVNTEFAAGTVAEQMEVLRKELVKANGGSDKLNYKTMRNNIELFEIIETILELNDVQGFENNDFFEQFVDYRNLALGDESSFYVDDNSLFTVNTVADGINKTLRQRINIGSSETVGTSLRKINAYEELNRLLSGRINIIDFIDRVKRSFIALRAEVIYDTFAGAVEKLPATFKKSGTFDEGDMLDLIAHVEASTGGDAIIIGTKTALAKVDTAEKSDAALERKNQVGFYGMFNGTPMMEIKQIHKHGGYEFGISDNDLWVVTANDKPIKFVTEGDAIFEQGTALDNADQTIDIMAAERWGVAVVLNQNYANYKLS